MGGIQQPFLFAGENYEDARFSIPKFDPKAVTRASYEVKTRNARPDGPLVSVNRHPDAHMIPSQRSMNYKPMSPRMKGWIKGIRVVQLFLRVLELVGGLGVLVLMIFLQNVNSMVAWVLRITGGVVAIHCAYAILHLLRPAGSKTPGSSAAYHTFAGISDLCVLPLYGYGVLSVRQNGGQWDTLLSDQSVVEYLVPAFNYTLIGAGGLHIVSLGISLFLGVVFRRIQLMPPDMNPLESHLTSRAHKRNNSSVALSTYSESSKRLSTPLEDYRRSGAPYEDLTRPPSVPFMHTRQSSETTLRPGMWDSRIDLPSRQYQIDLNGSPRDSRASMDTKRMSGTPPRVVNRGSYAELPHSDASPGGRSRPNSAYNFSRPGFDPRSSDGSGRPSSGTVASYRASPADASSVAAKPRAAKFSEAWYASDSLTTRNEQRSRAMHQPGAADKHSTYEILNPRYDGDDSDLEDEPAAAEYAAVRRDSSGIFAKPADDSDLESPSGHPNPLRSNPSVISAVSAPSRPFTPYHPAPRTSILSELSLNSRRVSGVSGVSVGLDQDIADEKSGGLHGAGGDSSGNRLHPDAWEPRNRNSSIQPEGDFYSKPYGELAARTPPLTEPPRSNGRRQVSSGVDFFENLAGGSGGKFGRRNVSGKVAEEGRAGGGSPWSWRRNMDD